MEKLKRLQSLNLRTLLDAYDVRQNAFAEKIGVTPVTVSNWVNGKTAISEYNARKIHEEYPYFSTDYILGLTTFANEDEQTAQYEQDEFVDAIERLRLFMTVVEKCGYELQKVVRKDDADTLLITKGEQTIELEMSQMDALAKEIIGYTSMRIDLMLERGEW